MTTVAQIAKDAFDGVAAAITDAVLDASLTDGVTTYDGRVVVGGEKAAMGFPMSLPKDRAFPIYLEGFGVAPSAGWEVTANSVKYFLTGVVDIVRTGGGFVVANAIAENDLLFQTMEIKRLERTDDGAGGYTREPLTRATVSGAIFAKRGNERWASDRIASMGDWSAIIEYVDGITADDYIEISGKQYAITFVNDVELRGKWLVLDLKEGAAV